MEAAVDAVLAGLDSAEDRKAAVLDARDVWADEQGLAKLQPNVLGL